MMLSQRHNLQTDVWIEIEMELELWTWSERMYVCIVVPWSEFTAFTALTATVPTLTIIYGGWGGARNDERLNKEYLTHGLHFCATIQVHLVRFSNSLGCIGTDLWDSIVYVHVKYSTAIICTVLCLWWHVRYVPIVSWWVRIIFNMSWSLIFKLLTGLTDFGVTSYNKQQQYTTTTTQYYRYLFVYMMYGTRYRNNDHVDRWQRKIDNHDNNRQVKKIDNQGGLRILTHGVSYLPSSNLRQSIIGGMK